MTTRLFPAALSAWLLFAVFLAGRIGAIEVSGDLDPSGTFRTLAGELREGQPIERFLLELMKTSHIPTLSVAVVQDDRVVFDRILGVGDPKSRKPADSRTVFRAASLSKPVFSYLIMKCADEGLLGLDQPLTDFIDPPFTSYPMYASLKDDARHRELTAAILLTHSAGFPNWRRPRWIGHLAFHFNPGEDFSYSGEDYYLLKFLLEEKTGRGLKTETAGAWRSPRRLRSSIRKVWWPLRYHLNIFPDSFFHLEGKSIGFPAPFCLVCGIPARFRCFQLNLTSDDAPIYHYLQWGEAKLALGHSFSRRKRKRDSFSSPKKSAQRDQSC